MAVRTQLTPIALPTVVGTSTAAQNVTQVSTSVRVVCDSTAPAGCGVALFACEDLTIGASSGLTFSATDSTTWPNAGVGVFYLGSIIGGITVPGGSPPRTILTSESFQPPGWGAGLIALRTAGTTAQNLLVDGLGTDAGSSAVTIPFVSITNKAGGGAIGAANVTVDVSSGFIVTQTTAGQTLTLPTPTATGAIRFAYVLNIGSATFSMYGVTVAASTGGSAYVWNGTAWGALQ